MSSIGIAERIRRSVRVDGSTGCWNWQLALNSAGYGRMTVRDPDRRLALAHRVSYQAFVGPIPDGLELDHLCRNRRCVNPAHLEAVTAQVNTQRAGSSRAAIAASVAVRLAKTHCVNGHELSGRNVIVKRDGHRQCRTCTVESTRRWRERIKKGID